LGEIRRIALNAATSLGFEALIRAPSWSVPPAVYFALHPPKGRPAGLLASGLSTGSRLRQSRPADEMPASLPPMPTVTSRVRLVSRSNWGGLVPPVGSPVCGLAKSSVVAEPQDASRNRFTPRAFATSLG